jgi:predicted RNA-binding Zn ribbon-like protein
MAPRLIVAAERLPLVAGCIALDFVNTTGARGSAAPRERLRAYGDLLAWGARVGLISREVRRVLQARASERPLAAKQSLAKLIGIRERIYLLLLCLVDGGTPRASDLRFLDGLWRGLVDRQQIQATRVGVRVTLRPREGEMDAVLWPVVASLFELLTSPDIEQARKCAECDWLFLDSSRNHSRRFCKILCADRARSRAYYARHRVRLALAR